MSDTHKRGIIIPGHLFNPVIPPDNSVEFSGGGYQCRRPSDGMATCAPFDVTQHPTRPNALIIHRRRWYRRLWWWLTRWMR